MSDIKAPIEISIWDIPAVKHKGRIYRVINSEKLRKGDDYIISGVDSDRYIDTVEEIQWDELYIRSVSNITDIEGLSSLTFLKKLELPNSTIKEIVGLEKLVHLEELDLSHNQIKVPSGLRTLVSLRKLHLNNNHISTLEGLRELRNLRELYLDNNEISYIDGKTLPISLEILSIRGNKDRIKFENLERLRNLKEFNK